MQDPSPFTKNLSSLNKRRFKGVRPMNTLPGAGPAPKTLDPQAAERDHKRPKFSTSSDVLSNVDILLNRAKSHVIHVPEDPPKTVTRSQPQPQPSYSAVSDFFRQPVDADAARLNDPPVLQMALNSLNHNGKRIHENLAPPVIKLTPDHRHIYVTSGEDILENLVMRLDQCKAIIPGASGTTTLVESKDNHGYMIVKHSKFGAFFYEIAQFDWPLKPAVSEDEIVRIRNDIDRARFDIFKSRDDADPVVTKQFESLLRRSQRVRSSANDAVQVLETPAKLEPPLEFKFNDGKTFTIGNADIKTLYNNEWINDNIIDFFINYEIEKAISKSKFTIGEIYNFNSFFFPRLTYRSDTNAEVHYYQNIRRWLTKVDLFSYSSIILPINEHLHWYGCVIVGLSELLKKAKRRKLQNYVEPSGPEEQPPTVNVFVFDSLSSRHTNIRQPITTFLIEHCKEKHNVDIEDSDFRFTTAKVQKQNNFNDCGIHVIYNVRKWLENRQECEKVWRSTRHNKHFLKSTEINGLRKELIKILINMHEVHGKVKAQEKEDSDDEVELLEYKTVLAKGGTRGPTPELEKKVEKPISKEKPAEKPATKETETGATVKEPFIVTIKPIPVPKLAPLEPKAKSDKPKTKSDKPQASKGLHSDALRKLDQLQHLEPFVIKAINSIIKPSASLSNYEIQKVFEFSKKVKDLDPERDEIRLNNETKRLNIKLAVYNASKNQVSSRPRDQTLVIKHANDLDNGINRLTIHSDKEKTDSEKEFDFTETNFKRRKEPKHEHKEPKREQKETGANVEQSIVISEDEEKPDENTSPVEIVSLKKIGDEVQHKSTTQYRFSRST